MIMSNKRNKAKKENSQKKEKNKGTLIGQISVALSIATIILGAYWQITQKIENINVNIAKLQENQKKLNDNLSRIDTESKEIYKDIYEDKGVNTQLRDIWDILGIEPYKADENFVGELGNVEHFNSNAHSSISRTTVIGTDANGNAHLADELIGKMVILVYTEDDKDVFFMGKFNDNYHWDGYCITNVYYKDGTLFGLCESNFDDGKRMDYISLYREDNNEWTYTNRNIGADGNSGITKCYTYSTSDVKNFTETNVRTNDFILPDDYIEQNDFKMLKYYSGTTSKEVYNDTSGNAYEVIYYSDGTVKTLYNGQFVDGTFNDSTGNAWDISYSEKEGVYIYNKGIFKNNYATDTVESEPVDLNRINKIIDGKKYDCELKWR